LEGHTGNSKAKLTALCRKPMLLEVSLAPAVLIINELSLLGNLWLDLQLGFNTHISTNLACLQ